MDTPYCTHYQTTDLGFGREHLEAYLARCGYWGNWELRRRNAYVLSPCAYVLSRAQEADIRRLGCATYAAVRTLSHHLCELARKRHPTHEEAALLLFANRASRDLLSPCDGLTHIPPLFKVDLVANPEGRFHIVEADVYNPRGFGYATLLEESLFDVADVRRFSGIAGLFDILRARNVQGAPLYVLVSEFERYYEPGFRILCDALVRRGIDARLVREKDLADGSSISDGVSLCIPDSLDRTIRDTLIAQYRQGTLRTIYPPCAYLGSKAFLPFLREQDGMGEFIPPTALVSKKCEGWQSLRDSGLPLVLKAHVSSGMKGVYFSDLDESAFGWQLAQAQEIKRAAWILQQQVPQVPTPIVVFDVQGVRRVENYYLRVVAYVTADGVLDVEVTGRPDRKVHGAPDCIQLPVILS